MKKFTAAVILASICYACSGPAAEKKPIFLSVNPQIGGGADAKKSTDTSAVKAVVKTAADGKALIEGDNCRACHQDKTKLVGPAYADVAKKYKEADIPHLAKKVIDGGAGVWGDIPMAPHAALSVEDAEAMIKYILTIK